jgi:uncharacterized protein (TIGR02145 family)
MKSLQKKWLRGKFILPFILPFQKSHSGILNILVLFFALFITGCEKEMQNLTDPFNPDGSHFKSGTVCEAALVASSNETAGTVSTTFDIVGDQLTVTYSTLNTGYFLYETHLDLQTNPAAFPQTPNGKPKVNQFAYGAKLSGVTAWSQVVDLTTVQGWNTGDSIYIAAVADVKQGQGKRYTVWGQGVPFPGKDGSMYFFCKAQPQPFSCGNPFVDTRNNKAYNTIMIGTQCWMAQNLNIGTLISHYDTQADNAIIEKYCQGDDESYCNQYGGLYRWSEMMQYQTAEGTKGICPDGWHLPTEVEFYELITQLEGADVAGGKMKSTGTIETGTGLWYNPNYGATNSSGFSALPGGTYDPQFGSFNNLGYAAYFWTSTQYDGTSSWDVNGSWFYENVHQSIHEKSNGFSVRCLQDY